jgi:hypothetical protein
MNKILMAFEFVFGCWHRNRSRPFTLSGWTYEVCLNCGKKFAYDRAEISGGAYRGPATKVSECEVLAAFAGAHK